MSMLADVAAIGFDVDNTLYDQNQHALFAFAKLSASLSEGTGLPSEVIRRKLVDAWLEKTSYYPNLFDDVLNELGIWSRERIAFLVSGLHNHVGPLELYPGTGELLQSLSGTYPLFIVTDGNSGMQRRKIDRLEVAHLFSSIVCTGEHPSAWRKPSPDPFLLAVQELRIPADKCLYVGDNPLCDFVGAHSVGMKVVRVLTGPFAGLPSPASVRLYGIIHMLRDLPTLLTPRAEI